VWNGQRSRVPSPPLEYSEPGGYCVMLTDIGGKRIEVIRAFGTSETWTCGQPRPWRMRRLPPSWRTSPAPAQNAWCSDSREPARPESSAKRPSSSTPCISPPTSGFNGCRCPRCQAMSGRVIGPCQRLVMVPTVKPSSSPKWCSGRSALCSCVMKDLLGLCSRRSGP
jgi:hypothetical protein